MGREGAILAGIFTVAAAALVWIMTWPAAGASPRQQPPPQLATVVDDEEPQVTVKPQVVVKPQAAVKPSGASLQSLRARALADGGAAQLEVPPQALATFGWGAGKGQLGRMRPRDGTPVAPMSLAASSSGIWVLDQVNRRVIRLDEGGQPRPDLSLPHREARDVAATSTGGLAVLLEQSVQVLDSDGKPLGELKTDGKAAAVWADGETIYVSKQIGWVPVGDVRGAASPDRAALPGLPTRDGNLLINADLIDGARGRVILSAVDRASKERRFARELHLGMSVLGLKLIDSDASGIIYLAAAGERIKQGASSDPSATMDLFCVDSADGRLLARLELPANTSADLTLRELVVSDGWGVLYLHRTEAQAQLLRVNCR